MDEEPDPLRAFQMMKPAYVEAGRRGNTFSMLPAEYGGGAGNFGMQRRRVHGVTADPSFNPRSIMDDEHIEFTKAMEGIDTVPGRRSDKEPVS